MSRRKGFTLMELLIASALGAAVVGLAANQLMEYGRLQRQLMARTQLRQDVQLAQEHLARRLRYAPHFAAAADGYVALVPIDACADGYFCAKDRVEVIWWRLTENPFSPGPKVLEEWSLVLGAFEPPGDLARLAELFKLRLGKRQALATGLTTFEITLLDPRTYRTHLAGERRMTGGSAVSVTLRELVAKRSLPHASGLPDYQSALEALRP